MNETTIKDMASIVRGHMSNGQAGKDALAALLARLAELEAAAAGETGTPKAEGRYWCETLGMAPERWWCLLWWDDGQWQYQHDCSWMPVKSSVRVLRYWHLPGETYTPTETPHDA